MPPVKYSFDLTSDYTTRLAEMADNKNVIKINPLTANKADVAGYLMYQLSENSSDISQLTQTVQTLSETVNTLSTTVNQLSTKVDSLSGKVTQLEKDIGAKDEEVRELRRDLNEANVLIANQKTLYEGLEQRLVKNEKYCLDLERHSRSSNVRIGEIAETTDEDCHDKVTKLLTERGLGHCDIANCHRVGEKKPGKTRMMIIRFMRKAQRREVLAKRKEFFEEGYPLYEDLPAQDLDTKKKYAKEIKDLHEKKNRCYFSRGVWYVNGVKKFC